jgi:Protein of unknown function (DUF2852)
MDFMIFPFVMIAFCVVMFVMMRGMGRMHGGDQTLLWSGKIGCCGLSFSPWNERADRTQSWWRQRTTSGNRTFDEYRTKTLRRLEQEQRDFQDFLARLRMAKDKAEFDQFMASREA